MPPSSPNRHTYSTLQHLETPVAPLLATPGPRLAPRQNAVLPRLRILKCVNTARQDATLILSVGTNLLGLIGNVALRATWALLLCCRPRLGPRIASPSPKSKSKSKQINER